VLWTFIFNSVALPFITVCDNDDNMMTTMLIIIIITTIIIITIRENITVFLLLNICTRYNNRDNTVMISWRLR